MSPEELARLHSSPQVKIISIDDERKIIQYDRLKLALEVMTAQQRATQERAEELQAEVERLQKQLRSCQVLPERRWFSEAELHRPDRCSRRSRITLGYQARGRGWSPSSRRCFPRSWNCIRRTGAPRR